MNDAVESWQEVKTQAKSIQASIDYNIQNLSKLLNGFNQGKLQGSFIDGQVKLAADLRTENENLMSKLTDVVDRMPRFARGGAVQMAQVQRYRDLRRDLQHQSNKLIKDIEGYCRKAQLFGNRALGESVDIEQGDAEANLLRERNAIDSSNTMMEDIISSASSTGGMIQRQTARFTTMTGKLKQFGALVPSVNGLMDRIRRRKMQETCILSLTVAICLTFMLWYKFAWRS